MDGTEEGWCQVDIRDVTRIAFEIEILSLEDTGELFVGVVLDSEKKTLLTADRFGYG
jgi:hypothetical protein